LVFFLVLEDICKIVVGPGSMILVRNSIVICIKMMNDNFGKSDLDECLNAVLEERNVCDPDAQRCVNTEGSFECVEKCQPGYEPDAIDPMGPCVDIDECGSSSVNGSRQPGVNHTCTLAEK